MNNCDLCNKQIDVAEAVQIPRQELQEAVRSGFNPFETYGFDMSEVKARLSLTGVGVEQLLQHWQQMVIADLSDWSLCTRCNEAFRRSRAFGYERGRIADPTVGEHYHMALWLYHRKGLWEDCIAELTKAIEQDPGFAEGYYWRADAYFEKAIIQEAEGAPLGEIVVSCERSIEDYSRALVLDPSDRRAFLQRNNVCISLGRTDDVVRAPWSLDQLSKDELIVISRPYADRYENLGRQIKARATSLK